MPSFQKREKAYLRQSSGKPGAPFSASASTCGSGSRCSELTVSSQEAGEPESRERLPAFQPSAHPSTHLLSQTCEQQPRAGPVLAEGGTLFSEPRFSQLGSCRDNCAGKACLPETKPFPAAARELIRGIITLHSPFSNQLIATAVNSLSQGQLAGTRGCNDCPLACPLWLSSFKRFKKKKCFFHHEALCHTAFHK